MILKFNFSLKLKNNILLILSFLIVITLLLTNLNNCFFWDTVHYGSVHSNYYFSTNFSNLIVPNDIDSGYINTFGMYVAFIWKIFGRTLPNSHLAMLPFAIGIVWQLYKLCNKLIKPEFSGIVLLLIIVDPTLLSQMTLVSPDVPMVFFFLLGVNAVFKNKKWLLAFSIILLFLTSLRGVMVSLCILLLDLYCNIIFKGKLHLIFFSLLKRNLIYIPAFIIFILFHSFHYLQKGWIFSHKDSPWANTINLVDVKGLFFNIGLLGWRVLDYGKIGIWFVFFILVIKFRNQTFRLKETQLLLFFLVCILIFVHANMLWANNMLAHRYFIPFNIIFSLLCATILFSDYVNIKLKYSLSIVWLIVLLSGNFWIYPPKIAKGWDSTLAHLPYYKLRNQTISYFEHEHINFKDVESFFPNTATLDKIDLNNDSRNFNNFEGKSKYVFYSNIFNIDDTIYDRITKEYKVVKYFKNRGVFITIYKKPK